MDRSDAFAEATARAALKRAGPFAVAATYDDARGEILVRLDNGVSLLLDPEIVQGLQGANAVALSDVEITPSGLGLHWPRLDADVYVPALLDGVSGSRAWMAAQLGRRGGQVSSRAKAEAARANGRKGGRPRKVQGVIEATTGHVVRAKAAIEALERREVSPQDEPLRQELLKPQRQWAAEQEGGIARFDEDAGPFYEPLEPAED